MSKFLMGAIKELHKAEVRRPEGEGRRIIVNSLN